MKKRVLSLLLVLLIVESLAPMSALASTNGHTAQEAIGYVQSLVGQQLDYDIMNGAQCVDLIKYYYDYLGCASYARGDAAEYATNALPSGWTRHAGAQPKFGDILVYTGGEKNLGHVAIYESDYVSYHQNFNGKQYVVRVTSKYNATDTTYWGVIRPDFASADATAIAINATNFPDANFRKLISNYDLDKSGKLSAYEISQVTDMNATNKNISSIAGIGYFTSLKVLYCNDNSISSLPALPKQLTALCCSNNKLTALPILPSGLKELYCQGNELESLPAIPKGVTIIGCSNNKLLNLPALPDSLLYLYCDNNKISDLPKIPKNLAIMECNDNQIVSMPLLPDTLTTLHAGNNKISRLTNIPSNITVLTCNNNKLESIPNLPNSLTYLDISNNLISKIPALPPALKVLGCGYNRLTEIPNPLPTGLTELWCASNSLTALPNLPSGLTVFSCANNRLNELPVLPKTITRLWCNGNQLSRVQLNPEAAYTYVNVSNNCLESKNSVTGRAIIWDEVNFVFGKQKMAHIHDYTASVTKPTCTEKGYTTYTCSCGDSYKSDYKAALGHDYKSGVCVRCEAKDPNYHPHTSFVDVTTGAFYYDAVQWAVANDITQGVGNNKFDPNGPCTRGQVVTFLWRAAGKPIVSQDIGFKDVSLGAFYYEAVKWAVANGITNGVGNGEFSPNSTCTRGQIVTFLYRANGQPTAFGNSGFSDVVPDAFYYSAVIWAVGKGITNGTGSGKFSPDATCTRGQVVTFLYRAK